MTALADFIVAFNKFNYLNFQPELIFFYWTFN